MTRAYESPEKGVNPALEQWAGAGLRSVLLPSGFEIRIRLIPVEQLIKRGLIPTELTSIALRFATSGVATSELDEAGMKDFLSMVDEVVALMIRDIKIGDEWHPVTVTPAMFEEFDLPGDDLEQLGLIAIRRKTPEIVTYESKLAKGLVDIADAVTERKEAEEAEGSTAPFRVVRGESEVPDPSSDGGDVRTEAERPRGNNRSRRSPRLRSSGVHPTS